MLHVLRHYLPIRKALLVLSETVILTVALLVGTSAHLWRPGNEVVRLLALDSLSTDEARWLCLLNACLAAVLAQIALSFNELYDFRISRSRHERARRFLAASGSAVLLVVGLSALSDVVDLGRALTFPGLPLGQVGVILTASLMFALSALWFWRQLFHFLLRHFSFDERILILGAGRVAQRLADEMLARSDSGYEIVAMIKPPPGADRRRRREDREPSPRMAATGTGPRLLAVEPAPRAETTAQALTEPLHEIVRRLGVDDVVVAIEERRGSLPTEELLQCRLDGVVVEEAEAFYERLTGKIPIEAMRPSYLIFNPGFLNHPLAQVAKRALDVALALVGIALTWPVMLAVALAVRLDSPGPILFRQERTGQRGVSFTLLKFRSMREDAEQQSGPVWAQEDDPRITRVGSFLRRSRLDELPQLFNILSGSMTLVGPRPERPHFIAELREEIPYFDQRHIVKPGLTGWAQINYPYGNTIEDALQKLQYDLFYIKYQSILFDLSILLNTVKTVVLRKGT
jgi:sugar transferase (PEP-CTERM system associated)